MGLVNGPGLRGEQGLGLEQIVDEFAPLGAAAHRRQQRFELGLLLRSGIRFERLDQREVLQAGLPRETMRIGCQEGERPRGVALVLGQMERHAAE